MAENSGKKSTGLLLMFVAEVILTIIVTGEAPILWVIGMLVAGLLLVLPSASILYKLGCIIGGCVCYYLAMKGASTTGNSGVLLLLMAALVVFMGVFAIARDHT